MTELINLRDKSNRYDPLAYLAAGDQLDDFGEGDGTLLRRQGYLLQVVFDLLWINGTNNLVSFLKGDASKHTDEFLVQARYRPTYIELVICPRALVKARVYGRLMRSCLQEDGKKTHGKEYIVKRTFELLAKMDQEIEKSRFEQKEAAMRTIMNNAINQVKSGLPFQSVM